MKIFCVGRNYIDHAKELNNEVPDRPVIFFKPPSAMLVNGKPFFYPEFSKDIQYEAELVIKICKNGKKIAPRFAYKYYNKITIGIDLTARDVQTELKQKGLPWDLAKGFDGSAVLGKLINISDLKHPDNIEFSLSKNDITVQHGQSKDMIFSFSELIAYISNYFIVQTGDLIFTGTPAGVGPIKIGDNLKGFLERKQLLNFNIR